MEAGDVAEAGDGCGADFGAGIVKCVQEECFYGVASGLVEGESNENGGSFGG